MVVVILNYLIPRCEYQKIPLPSGHLAVFITSEEVIYVFLCLLLYTMDIQKQWQTSFIQNE